MQKSILFGRHFYTASMSRGGFGTLSVTNDLDLNSIESVLLDDGVINSYEKPSVMSEPETVTDLKKFPISTLFYTKGEDVFLSKIHYTGRCNHTPNRFGNFFSDCLIMPFEDFYKKHNLYPHSILDNPDIQWKAYLTNDEDKNFPKIIENPTFYFEEDGNEKFYLQLMDSFNKGERQIDLLSILLQKIIEEGDVNFQRKIIICGELEEINHLIFTITALFSNKLLKPLTFITYIAFPEYSNFFINGVTSNLISRVSRLSPENYIVVNLEDEINEVVIKSDYVKLIVALIKNRDIDSLTRIMDEDYRMFEITSPNSTIDRVAKFHIILNKITPESIDLKEILKEYEVLQNSLRDEGIQVTEKKVVLFKKAANVNPGALNEFFKSELQVSTTQAALKTITLLYKDFYLCYLKPENSEGADNLNYPNQFLKHSLKQAGDNLKPLDFSGLCLDLFIELEEHLDQINSDVLNQMGVAAVKLLEPELLNATEQLPIRDQLRPLNLKYQLNLNLEPEFEVHEVVDDIENEITEGKSWSEKIRLFFVGMGERVSKSKVFIYLKKLLTPLFKKKLTKSDWIDLFVLIHAELDISDVNLIAILKNQVLKSDFSIRQKKYFFRNMILTCSKHGLNSILKLSLDDDEILQVIVFDDFVEYLEDCIELNEEEHVKHLLSLFKEKIGGDKS